MNLEQVLELAAKYGPTIIKIVQADGPVIQAFLADLKALKAGQAPSAVIPSLAAMSPITTTTVATQRFP